MLNPIRSRDYPELLRLLNRLSVPSWMIEKKMGHLKWVNQATLSLYQHHSLSQLKQQNLQNHLNFNNIPSLMKGNSPAMSNMNFSQLFPYNHAGIKLEDGEKCFFIGGGKDHPDLSDGISPEKLLRIINNLPQVIFTAINDGNWSIDFLSEGCLHLTGYHSSELIVSGQNIYNSLIYPEDSGRIIQSIEQAIAQHIPYEVEYRITTKSGDEKWIYEQGRGLYSKSGQADQIEGSLSDITHLKQIEQSLQNSEKRYQLLADNTTDLITLHAPNGDYRYVSPICHSLLGYTPDVFYNFSPEQLCHPDDKGRFQQFYESLQKNHYLNSITYRVRHCQGYYIWLETNAKVITNGETGDVEEIIFISSEITKQKQAEEALRQSAYQYRNIFDNITQGIFQTSKEGRYLTVNPALAKLYGYDSAADLINNLIDINHQLYVDSRQRDQLIKRLEKEGQISHFESQVYRKDGSKIWISENTRAVYDAQGIFLYYEGTVEDITYRRQTEAKLFEAAYRDPLTQLPNRLWFTSQFEQVMKRHVSQSMDLFAVLFIDLDGFKRINESLGHDVGDKLLKLVAFRLKQALRETDTVARFGGDKFVILLGKQIHSLNDIINISERILQRFRVPFNLAKETLFMGVSIGITTSKIGYQRTEDVLRDAEVAMYQAKASGKDCYVLFDKTMYTTALSRLQLESDLRQAITNQEFTLYYQPIIELEQGQLVGFEALIRWCHPQKGWVSPVDFIPIAEETGLINAIGWWVTEEACRQLHYWQQKYPQTFPLKMNINLSTYQLTQQNLVEKIEEILQQTQVQGKDIKLEITESCFLETMESDVRKIESIKMMGLGLCIDDFGTGYSSLNRLHEFPIDTLKIDRTFTNRLESSPTPIIQLIVTLAHTLGMDVVAEGIETQQQLEHLKAIGCGYGQGYLFSRPVDGQSACQFFEDDSPIQQYFNC
ncbi:MAG: EAL domain-containing protein [Microcystaceae cyanobacterium]